MENQLHQYFQGELKQEERLRLLRAIESNKELKQEFIELKNLQTLASYAYNEEKDHLESGKSYHLFIRRLKHKRLLNLVAKAASIAAAVIVLVTVTYLYTINQVQNLQDEQLLSLHVPAGQRLKFTLQDGTSVWLNSRSTLYYPASFTKDKRRVAVEGEALFNVTHDAERPFIVSAEGIDMKVLGTTFNVFSYPETEIFRTSLLEGSLMVYPENDESGSVVLKPSEQVTVEKGKMKVERIPDTGYFLWTEGIYSFYNESLANILKKLELYFDIEIIVKDPTIYTWEYTGKFRQRDGIDEILRIINKIHKFKIEKDEGNNRIILSR
ncbi:FecR domain-containing protein [Massilibacteroides vaginae]|uniref:FecR domain-containing protein n=1 Tax=Massilibacteroides vaginae TaxID=1673718 RepID=UPI000A1CB0E7|nr:FecR domain-containing protein [Massilibacteroides vaginae]